MRVPEKTLGMTSNQLKIIALLTMTCDHVGMMLFPDLVILRLIGRIAMPIYAFMIAQGCRYTRSRTRYLLGIAGLGLFYQAVCLLVAGSLYQCILVTFSLSIGLICLLDWGRKRHPAVYAVLMTVSLAAVFFATVLLPGILRGTDFAFDYGFMGVLLPVMIYLAEYHDNRFAGVVAGIVLLNVQQGGAQWFSVLALPLLALYNGQRGKSNLKWLFYMYYPLHLVLIQLAAILFST